MSGARNTFAEMDAYHKAKRAPAITAERALDNERLGGRIKIGRRYLRLDSDSETETVEGVKFYDGGWMAVCGKNRPGAGYLVHPDSLGREI